MGAALSAASPGESPKSAGAAADDQLKIGDHQVTVQGFVSETANTPSIFPDFWKPYQRQPVILPVLENSPRLSTLIQDGKLNLSLADALALTLENNLDIFTSRYVIPFSEVDLMRTRSGQASRGITGALSPSALSSGAIGAGVSSGGGTGGTGNAGGITGSGGAVNVGSTGAFDPTVTIGTSYDRVNSPLNSVVVSGIPTTTSSAVSVSTTYAQMLTNGSSYSVSFSGLRQATTQKNTLFNPYITSRLSMGFNQPLLAGFGKLSNERFMLVARNNLGTGQEVFRAQVIASIVQVENAYWDFAAAQLNVRVAEESLAAAKELLAETSKQAEIGTMSRIDVVTAESQAAASQRDLIVAQTTVQQQQTALKQLISKHGNPALDAATLVVTDAFPEPRDADLPPQPEALASAQSNRPELRQALNNLQNQDIAIRYAKDNLRPSLALFGLYASSGLDGNTALATSGVGGSLSQSFGAAYPETATGMSFSAAIRNRSAQADSLRAQLERNQLQVSLQNTRNQIASQVLQARIALIQGKSQVEAAHEAIRLAQLSLDAERKKLEAGLSTSYNVVLRERDLATAEYADVQALSAYAKAIVSIDQATGTTLDRNGIQLSEALSGNITNLPVPPFHFRAANAPASAPALAGGGK
jgi:outer membrane protein TolC